MISLSSFNPHLADQIPTFLCRRVHRQIQRPPWVGWVNQCDGQGVIASLQARRYLYLRRDLPFAGQPLAWVSIGFVGDDSLADGVALRKVVLGVSLAC